MDNTRLDPDLEDNVIDEMMDAYWRHHADTLDPDAGQMLNKALDVFAETRVPRPPSEGEDKETP